jgi:subtilisin family serine protease
MLIAPIRIFFISLFLSSYCFAARFIIQGKNSFRIGDIFQTRSDQYTIVDVLFSSKKIYLIESDLNIYSLSDQLREIRQSAPILNVMKDEKLSLRSIPNDPFFPDLWNLSLVSAPQAWERNVGGEHASGVKPVIAIVDGGFTIPNLDLNPNLWTNKNEVPGNGIDDDSNGYIDDRHGWDAYEDDGDLPDGVHGTHVAGIASAKGDNSHAIVGVNWNAELMLIAASSSYTSIVIKGYDYALKSKQRWLNSSGAEGAYVVATNSSFGVDRADCASEDYSLWNSIYNEMGKFGIISVAATANENWNIDEVGDVPTGCTSPFIISVTNTTKEDKLFEYAGWGKRSVDLAAPGTNVKSNFQVAGTLNLTGTSMATPHVAGAVALLYSSSTTDFHEEALKNPAQSAQKIIQALYEGVDKLESLKNKTSTGGRLNLVKAQNYLLNN